MRHCFNIEIAKKFNDTNIATIFENLCYWIAYHKANNTNSYEVEIDGQMEVRTFTYNSTSAFCTLFPYWTRRQIDTYLLKLREANLIIKDNFNKKGWDRTSWYCLVDESWLSDRVATDEKEQNNPSPEPVDTKKQSLQSDKETVTTEQENEYLQTEKCIPSNEEVHITKRGNAFHQTGKCILPNGEMHFTKRGNAFHQTGKPIPDINSDINTVAATANLKAIFNSIDGTLVFDKEFYPMAVLFMHNYSVSDFTGYCKWLYEQVKSKSPKNFRGYYYKVFCLEDNILSYLASEKKEAEKHSQEVKKQRKCPVCDSSTENMIFFTCSECGFDMQDFENEKKIVKWKKYATLPDERKKEYDLSHSKIIQNTSFTDYKSLGGKLEELDIKYGLIREEVIT